MWGVIYFFTNYPKLYQLEPWIFRTENFLHIAKKQKPNHAIASEFTQKQKRI
ncbi:hypothetical protein APA_277 [Pseudanabaena sp. lw0831]|nr:hypothetical protein APA_277 [Pseudanabaena sp. lw0831]